MGRCQGFACCDTMHLSLVIEEFDLGKARFAGAKALIDDLEEGAKR